ncbi:hypothetical protein DPMN_091399 [Dreissena polymorpha]|uniref:Uncharacterized protein n=1 Tax=Dreissena polymorpha TaxID=45954 RepID=A0A9D4QZ74_DREPO|nr:hypothetical protein DPMN_091399 [Dreissena polymorpha]
MNELVRFQRGAPGETLAARVAPEGLVPAVSGHVLIQVALLTEHVTAYVTREAAMTI